MTTQKTCFNRVSSLKALLKKKNCIRVLEAHSGLSGLVVEQSGFDAIWESSLTDSGSKGLPDIELVTMDSRFHSIQQILDITTKPMIVDCDTGGQLEHFSYWVQKLENVGISAIIIEDKAFPKKNSLDSSAKHILEDVDIFAKKIKYGVAAKRNKDFMIIARLESLIAKHSMQHALLRAEAFIDAGADGIMIHSKSKVGTDEIIDFAKRFRKMSELPLVCVPTTYNDIFDKELEKIGFNIVIHANHLLRASLKAMKGAASQIEKEGRSININKRIASVKDIFQITGYNKNN